MAKGQDMTKLTQRQRRKAGDLEKELRKDGVPPREAESRAWKQVAEHPDGKRSRNHTYRGRAKIKSSATSKSRKTHAGPKVARAGRQSGRIG